MQCIVLKSIMARGRHCEPGDTVSLDGGQYARLAASGHVRSLDEHRMLLEAEEEQKAAQRQIDAAMAKAREETLERLAGAKIDSDTDSLRDQVEDVIGLQADLDDLGDTDADELRAFASEHDLGLALDQADGAEQLFDSIVAHLDAREESLKTMFLHEEVRRATEGVRTEIAERRAARLARRQETSSSVSTKRESTVSTETELGTAPGAPNADSDPEALRQGKLGELAAARELLAQLASKDELKEFARKHELADAVDLRLSAEQLFDSIVEQLDVREQALLAADPPVGPTPPSA
ncbi:MAG: hypothetical protein AB7T06_29270 [Kofleriaceae bacterium]